MDQAARIGDGSGNIIVQAVESTVTVGLPPQLKLSPRHLRKRAPKPGVDIDLLNPFNDAIPFLGREADLGRLKEWLASPKPISARCLIGRAGAGKTRLALQLCELAEALTAAWDAGFVEHRELERFASLQNLSAWGWQRPTLIVIDYAAGVTRWLRPWLEELAENLGRDGAPLRLLLLDRFADPGLGWWAELMRTGFSDAAIPELFDPPEPEPLYPIGAEHRGALLTAIRAAAKRAAPEPVPEAEEPHSRHPRACPGGPWIAGTGPAMTDEAASDQPEALDLLMAGLIAARQLAPAEDGRPWSRTAMATGVARHERSRIERLAKDRNVSAATLAHLVAVVTLGGGIAIDAARPMIEEELAALPRSDSGSALDLREVLIEALREKERARIPPVVPDLIGEAFVVDAFGKLTPAEQGEAVARGYRRSPNATAATVIRTAQDFAETEDHPALSWIDELAERCETINDLMQLADAFPHDTVVLRERAAAITANVANHLRSAAEESVNPDALATRARWLNDLSGRLSALGRREEALLAVEESVAIYRDLVRGRSVASLYGLARALTNFASWLGDLGRHEEALSASEDSVAILRELATGSPDALLPRLAGSLTNFANTLSHVGRREEALSAADESAAIYRKLASKRPDAFRAGLAMALITLASWRSAGGAWEEALSAAGESVAIYRELERDDFTSGHIRRARNSLCIRLR